MAIKKHLYTKLGTTLWALAAVFAILPSWPHLYYRLNANASTTLASTIASTTEVAPVKGRDGEAERGFIPSPFSVIPGSDPESSKPAPPPLDLSLPTQNGLIIEKIGVKGEINEGEDWEKILRKGLWRVPEFGTPTGTDKKPIIIAAHRWGYLEWSAAFRKLNSFYSLPKLQEGDRIELNWEQRKYKYEVVAISTGTKIDNYGYDLILYTCQLWNSPVRFFVYANRTN